MPRQILLLLGISQLGLAAVKYDVIMTAPGDCPNWYNKAPTDTKTVDQVWADAGCTKDPLTGFLSGDGCCACWGYRTLAADGGYSAGSSPNSFQPLLDSLNDKAHASGCGLYNIQDPPKDCCTPGSKTCTGKEDPRTAEVKKHFEDHATALASKQSGVAVVEGEVGFRGLRLCSPKEHVQFAGQYGACANHKEGRWTTQEEHQYKETHRNDGVKCRNYGRNNHFHECKTGCAKDSKDDVCKTSGTDVTPKLGTCSDTSKTTKIACEEEIVGSDKSVTSGTWTRFGGWTKTECEKTTGARFIWSDYGLCMWEFRVDADKKDGLDDDHTFECMTVADWKLLDVGRDGEKAGMWIGIIFIAILMAWPAAQRMPCYKKLCSSDHDFCCKSAKDEVHRRHSEMTTELAPDSQQAAGPE